MIDTPPDPKSASEWEWERVSPLADELMERDLKPSTVERWLADWSALARLIGETFNRLYIRTTTHTGDESGRSRFGRFSEDVMPRARAFEQAMRSRLLGSGLRPAGFDVPLRRIRSDAVIYREENLPLQTEAERLDMEFNAVTGARSFDWDGRSLSQTELIAKLGEPDRATREAAWKALSACVADQRPAMDRIWTELLGVRTRMAANAGFGDYRSFRWSELARFDYTPDDCKAFGTAIREVVVPAVGRLAEKRRRSLNVDSLRVWDDHWHVKPDPRGRPPLRPFETIEQLTTAMEQVFGLVHPTFAAHFRTLRRDGLLDLDARGNKAQGAYMMELPATGAAFIFATAVGVSDDVLALLHEGGHAFHALEATHWPHHYQSVLEYIPMEFVEFASMGMELLGSRYLGSGRGGFYSDEQLARALCEQLTGIIEWWPYMAVVDGFQHWVYENPETAGDTERCDEAWASLHREFMPHLDWTGIEDSLGPCWRLQDHIFLSPFYYVEYGIAQLGALQLWANSIDDPDGAVAAYRAALSLGNTASLPDLYRAAGVRLAFDRDTLAGAVQTIEQTIHDLAG